MTEGCKERVHSGGRAPSFHTCGRKLAGDPEFPDLCGLHVAVIHRRRAKDQARDEARERSEAEHAAVDARAKAVSEALGIEAVPEWSYPASGPEMFISRPTGRVKVDLAELEVLVEQVKRLGKATFL